jgi:hypothetical protein
VKNTAATATRARRTAAEGRDGETTVEVIGVVLRWPDSSDQHCHSSGETTEYRAIASSGPGCWRASLPR